MSSSPVPLSSTGHLPGIHPAELAEAVVRLGEVVRLEAQLTARRVGFGWRPCVDAPDGYDRLRAAYRQSKRTGVALPVSNLYCDRTIYGDADTNVAMRFWHDVHHVERGCDFSALEEVELALWHLDVLCRHGLEPTGLSWRLLHADLVGQTYCSALLGHFPDDQRQFVLDCVAGGLEWALLVESGRKPEHVAIAA